MIVTSRAKVQAAISRVQHSTKFRKWRPPVILFKNNILNLEVAVEKHYSPTDLAKAWGVSVETIRSIFRAEPGVLKLGRPGTRFRRGYFTLRIPETVAERVHQRLSERSV
jgi:hypothetical protein